MSQKIKYKDARSVIKAFPATPIYYKLDGKKPVPCSPKEWSKTFADPEVRKIVYDEVGDAQVSTVFLGIDHSYGKNAQPLFFETMVFGGKLNGDYYRFTTYDEAIEGHATVVELVRHYEAEEFAKQRKAAVDEASREYEDILAADSLLQSHKG